MTRKTLFNCAALVLSARLAGAAVLLNDSFNYTDGPIVTVSGGNWSHHSGSISGQVQVVSGRALLNSTDTEDVSALLSGQPYDPAGTTNQFYAGLTVRFTSLPSAGGNYFALFKDASATGFRARIWALTGGAAPGKFRLGISSTTNSISATNLTDLSLNTDYTVVARLVNTNSAAKLWIDPAAESDPSISSSDGTSAFTVVAYAFRESSGEGTLSVDNLRVGTSFTDVVTNAPPLQAPAIISPPSNQAVTEGGTATFVVNASGDPAPTFQWQFKGTNLAGAESSALAVTNVAFTQSGFYTVMISNALDAIVSKPVVLNVFSAADPALSLLTYNLHGNGALNWSTNVQAIGRQIRFLDPDILTFQEVPATNNGTAQMTYFVTAFRPGFYLAANSADDGFIRSVILSRFPIVSSQSWLHGSDLTPYGYTASGFTRDLFEAQIAVPGFPQPLHVFTVHLKSGAGSADDAAKRAAEAGAVSNFLVSAFLAANGLHPYLLTGDMNEDILRLATGSEQPIQRLTSAATGLQLTTPFNPISNSELSFSIQSTGGLSRRYDYILPGGLLYSNAVSSQVFRTDLLSPTPPGLFGNDDQTASDHLPVLMVFGNPYTKPFQLTLVRTNQGVALNWNSVPGQTYRVEISPDLANWATFADNLLATNGNFIFSTGISSSRQFFRVRRWP